MQDRQRYFEGQLMHSKAAEQIPGKRVDVSTAFAELRNSIDGWNEFSKVRPTVYFGVR